MSDQPKLDPREEDFYNPHSDMRESLRKAEKAGGYYKPGNHEETNETVENKERNPNFINRTINRARNAKFGMRAKKKSAAIMITLALVGGGGFSTIMFTPSIAIVAMKEVFTHALNDQLRAVDVRSKFIINSKMNSVSPAVCGAIKICNKFSKMSDIQAKDFEKNNSGTKIERTSSGRIKTITFKGDQSKFTLKNPTELAKALDSSPEFRAAWSGGYNPKYKSMSDGVFKEVLFRNKASKNEKITGKDDAERRKSLNRIAGGVEDTGAKVLTPVTDENGKTTHYVDENGNTISEQAAKSANDMEKRIEDSIKNGGTKGMLKNSIGKAVQIDFTADMSCTLFNGIRHVSALAKLVKQSQAIRYAMALVLTPADKIKAGDATEDLINFSANTLMDTSPNTEVWDESKLTDQAKAGDKLPTKTENIGNAFDSKGFRLANGDTIGPLDSREARFSSAGAGGPAMMDNATSTIASVVTGGNRDPNVISKACKYIQSPFVRVGAFAAGIATGVATFGVSTVVLGVSSIGLQLAMPLIESQLGDMIAGDAFKDIKGDDSGNASYVGAAGAMGQAAQLRAMAPVTTTDGKGYLVANSDTQKYYDSIDKYISRGDPLNINNPNSFLGSITMAILPSLWQARTNTSIGIMQFASLLPKSINNIFNPSAGALQNGYFGKCNDMMYQSLGIDAGPFCEVRYYMSDYELNLNPLQNAAWMVNTGNIDPESDWGEPIDNGADWNYTKFLSQCVTRSEGWGEVDIEDPQSGTGSNCMDPKYKEVNSHYRVYTMDKSVQKSMDEDNANAAILPSNGFGDDTKNQVSDSGWAYPTSLDVPVINKFGKADTLTDRNGITLGVKNSNSSFGQPIFAAYPGTVLAAGPASILNTSTDFGNWIVIESDLNGEKISTVYGHMANGNIFVRPGDKVKAGQQIGRIGSNRTTNDNAYLAFQVWKGSPLSGGQAIEPEQYINQARKTPEINL